MNDLLAQGAQLMVLGMGVVLAFLLILVAVMTGLSALVQRFAPDTAGGQTANVSAPEPAPQVSPHIRAAIQDAIRQHRAQR